MRKKLVFAVFLVLTVFAVSLVTGAQAYSPPTKREFLYFVADVPGTYQITSANPSGTQLGDVFWGTGTASWMGKVSTVGAEVLVFNAPPPTFTHVSLAGTFIITDNWGNTLKVTYQCNAGATLQYYGTFQIAGGTGRFEYATGSGVTWGTTTPPNPTTGQGTYTECLAGWISF